LVEAHELVRLKKVMDIGFELIGKQVVTLSKQRLGKVSDYSVEAETMYVQKLYVSQGILKGLTKGNLAVDRSQINEITDKKIIVNDLLDSATVPAGAAA
jgi:sporulation protein YlmC with PRC-barrel domain